jgi:hypothetical protein
MIASGFFVSTSIYHSLTDQAIATDFNALPEGGNNDTAPADSPQAKLVQPTAADAAVSVQPESLPQAEAIPATGQMDQVYTEAKYLLGEPIPAVEPAVEVTQPTLPSAIEPAMAVAMPKSATAEPMPLKPIAPEPTPLITVSKPTIAPPESIDPPAMGQVTSVSQLSDVRPTDWSYQALQSLVERYGCIAGYPDKTYRGNRALSRYEFAAGLNACLEQVNGLIGSATENAAKASDLATIRKLQSDFSSELTVLNSRVDTLESKTTQLTAQSFSTTTKLMGITILGVQGRLPNIADRAPRDGVKDTADRNNNVNVINWNYLILTTAFSPRSLLTTSLLNVKGTANPLPTNDGRLSYDYGAIPGVVLYDMNYRSMIGDSFAFYVGTGGIATDKAFRGPNRAEGAATGPISMFAQRNPLQNIGLGSGGAGFDWQFHKRASLQGVFHTRVPGVFPSSSGPKGYNTFGLQLALTPIDPLDISLYYINAYSPNGALLQLVGDDLLVAPDTAGRTAPLQTNAIGTTVNWQVSKRLNLGGWFGYTNSYIPGQAGRVETANYMLYANFPDLFGPGNMGGFYIGRPPKIISSNLPAGRNIPDFLDTGLGRPGDQPGNSTHVELFYRWQVHPRISITPGVFAVFQPGHTRNSDPVVVGAIRTSFFW